MLGIRWDKKSLFIEQVSKRGKLGEASIKLAGLCRNKGKIDKEKIKMVAERVVQPAALYGAEVWGGRARDSRVIKHLAAAQRKFLLAAARCYRTVATETLRVLTGMPPWHLLAECVWKFRMERKDEKIMNAASECDRPFPGWELWYKGDREYEGWKKGWVDASVGEWGTGIGVVGEEVTIAQKWDEIERTSLEAELLAIKEAVVWVEKENEGGFLILTDSRLAVEFLGKDSIHKLVEQIRNRVGSCRMGGKTVALEWTQRESKGIIRADRVAKGARVAVDKQDFGNIKLWDRKGIRRREKDWVIENWQLEWDGSEKGREVYELCREVGCDRLPLSFKGSQLLTGHGNLKCYLKRFGLVREDDLCVYGGAGKLPNM